MTDLFGVKYKGESRRLSYSEYIIAKAVENRDREMIARKLLKGRSPEWIHEEDEYPMELILDVQRALSKEDVS